MVIGYHEAYSHPKVMATNLEITDRKSSVLKLWFRHIHLATTLIR